MIRLTLLLFGLFLQQAVFSQQFNQIVPLSSSLGESSGLIFLNGKIITHNDSQGEAALYEIDSITGDYSRKVIVANASNSDWEDITHDSTHIFIGDFGNNGGNRTNLRIFRVLIDDYLNTPNDTVYCDTIQFSYADQTDFTYNPQATNWDCEALASIGDSLYLFSKNWVNAKTYVYPLSKLPGTYVASKSDSINVQGLITGADYHIPSNRLILCGYTQYPFVVEMNDPMAMPFGQNSFLRYNLPNTGLIQLEAIVTYDDNKYYLTAETFQAIAVRLYRLEGLNGVAGTGHPEGFQFSIFPNPSHGKFTIILPDESGNIEVKIIDIKGKIISANFSQKGNILIVENQLQKGEYLIQISSNNKTWNKKIRVN